MTMRASSSPLVSIYARIVFFGCFQVGVAGQFVIYFCIAEHALSTDISNVGLQVWRGALLLSEFILHNKKTFLNTVLLELGSGVGLVGIVAAQYCIAIFCTGNVCCSLTCECDWYALSISPQLILQAS